MGADGSGPFENDDAADWLAELETADDFSLFERAFEDIKSLMIYYVEAPAASVAVAAAEVVAIHHTGGGDDVPPHVASWIDNNPDLPDRLVREARRVIDRISTRSELKELWDNTGEPDWQNYMKQLKSRLSES